MKGRVEIDGELCKGCNYCVITCPMGIIEMDSAFNKAGYYPVRLTDPAKCTGCVLCAEVCPELAIMVWRENVQEKL
ncbi:MAG TPA: 4Fe-4S dicluster domain-containing protein [Nitrospirae bacterium]|nr:4Fe-4S dicluster domain-containing protein [Nitrospirota bacterium]